MLYQLPFSSLWKNVRQKLLRRLFQLLSKSCDKRYDQEKNLQKKHLVKGLLAVLEDEFMTILAESLAIMALEQ